MAGRLPLVDVRWRPPRRAPAPPSEHDDLEAEPAVGILMTSHIWISEALNAVVSQWSCGLAIRSHGVAPKVEPPTC